MGDLKTKATGASAREFLAAIPDPARMWGSSIVGFGHYEYEGRGGQLQQWFPLGFASRKQALTLDLTGGVERHPALLANLGRFRTGKSCLYSRSARRRGRTRPPEAVGGVLSATEAKGLWETIADGKS